MNWSKRFFRITLNKYTFFLTLVLVLLAFGLTLEKVIERSSFEPNPITTSAPTPTVPEVLGETDPTLEEGYLVKKVVDGDTIEVERAGKEYKIRYIGVDTPESVKVGTPVECFGKEASEFNKKLVEGKEVFLQSDVGDKDKYGRYLRYVYIKNPSGVLEMVNSTLIREGYANTLTIPPNVKYKNVFLNLEKQARGSKVGLWGSCSN